jgi:hydroxymethylbilane synthase
MPLSKSIILGARKSPMAIAVAQHVKTLVLNEHPDFDLRIETFLSDGCKITGDLRPYGGKGTFVKDLERRLLAGEVHCAVHALKDVPGDEDVHPDLVIFSFLKREDPRDALLMRDGVAMPQGDGAGLVLATSSPRRTAFLRALYPAAQLIPLRGNVDTRFRKLQEGAFDGMVLSYAGLQRLGLEQHVTHIYEPHEMLPAVGQGVLCLQALKVNVERCSYLSSVHCVQTAEQITAERAMLRALEGNCHSVIAGYCTINANGTKTLCGVVGNIEGTVFLQSQLSVAVDESSILLGQAVAADLIKQGAAKLICA